MGMRRSFCVYRRHSLKITDMYIFAHEGCGFLSARSLCGSSTLADEASPFCPFLLLSRTYCSPTQNFHGKAKKDLHFKKKCVNMNKLFGETGYAPLAQLDRASGYGPEGRGFESLRAYQSHGNSTNFRGFVLISALFRAVRFWTIGLTQAATHTRARSGNYRRAPERKLPTVFAACFCMDVVTWA